MKYKGSKKRLMKYLNPIFDKYKKEYNLNNFIDVFCGGANVATNLSHEWENIWINDNDRLLISLLSQTKNEPESIECIKTPSKEQYDIFKYTVKNEEMSNYDFPLYFYAAILFFGSFNSRAYGGNYGATTITKNGNKRDYFQEAKRNILKQDFSKITKISNYNYNEIDIPKNSLVYLDPPYKGTTGYKGKTFNHEDFWNWVRNISKNNIVLISELWAPDDFECVWEKELIHGQNQFKKMVKNEKLFKMKSNMYGGYYG